MWKSGLGLVLVPLLLHGIILGSLASTEPSRREAERHRLQAQEAIARAESAVRVLVQEKDRLAVALLTPGATPASGTRRPVAELEALRQETADIPASVAGAADLVAGARAMETWISGIETLVREGRKEEAARLIGTEGEGLRRDLLAKLGRFEARERDLIRKGSVRLDSIRRIRRALFSGAATATIAASLVLAWLFYRKISSRLALVAASARRIAENVPLDPPLAGADEISRLDMAFRQTARHLTETIRLRDAALEHSSEELEKTNQELLAKTEELEAFIRGVSHDLRSPLVNIKGFGREIDLSCKDLHQLFAEARLESGTQERFETIDREIREAVYYLGTAVASADRIITALERLARAGHRHFDWQLLNIHEIVSRIVDAMRLTVSGKGAEVTVSALPPAWGDAVAVEQIFSNLVKNALSYLDPKRPGRIEIGAEDSTPGAPVTYWVRDNGVGIPSGKQERIFTAFQRLRADLAEGEGIGLALVHRSVTRLSGWIRVESREGEGSAFFVTLPSRPHHKATPLPFTSSSRLTG